jgi:hypothetical protein
MSEARTIRPTAQSLSDLNILTWDPSPFSKCEEGDRPWKTHGFRVLIIGPIEHYQHALGMACPAGADSS